MKDSVILEAALLREKGLGYKRIARQLDISPTSVRRILNPDLAERHRVQSREAKQRRKGTCEDCGSITSYNGHERGVSQRCLQCTAARNGLAARGKGKVQLRILGFLDDGPRRAIEIRHGVGISKGHASHTLHRLLQYGLVERERRGVYRKAEAP